MDKKKTTSLHKRRIDLKMDVSLKKMDDICHSDNITKAENTLKNFAAIISLEK